MVHSTYLPSEVFCGDSVWQHPDILLTKGRNTDITRLVQGEGGLVLASCLTSSWPTSHPAVAMVTSFAQG